MKNKIEIAVGICLFTYYLGAVAVFATGYKIQEFLKGNY